MREIRSLEVEDDINFLFCNHPLYPCRVDEDYEEEYQAASLHHSCALFNYEDMENGKLSLYGDQLKGLTIYRGWMMKPEMYRVFYKLLEEKGIILINSPDQYERYHLLPGWYQDFMDVTPESIWGPKGSINDLIKRNGDLDGAYIVKDYVKSRKHEWYDACYIPDISDENNARKIIGNFVERQGESLEGGIVLRKFVDLMQIGYHELSGMPISEEYRLFVYAGKVIILDNYWRKDQKAAISKDEHLWIENICRRIKSNFVTLGLARTVDGKLIVMELGDGQVSGLQQIKADWFYNEFPYSIPIEDLFENNTVVLASEPLLEVSIEEMRERIVGMTTVQQLVDTYANVFNKFWFVEDQTYDYEEGTVEYNIARQRLESWGTFMEELESKVIEEAIHQNLLKEREENHGLVKQLEPFMNKYGYRDGCGWWVRKSEDE